MDWQPLAEMFTTIPLSVIKQTCSDCATMDQCVTILTEYNDPILKLEEMFPDVELETIEQLYHKLKDINKVVELLSFEDEYDKAPVTSNQWHAKVPLSNKIKKMEAVQPRNKPLIRPVVQKQYILVPLEDVIESFYCDKELTKSSSAYHHDMETIMRTKQDLISKSRNAYGHRRSKKFSGQGATVASTYSQDVRDLELGYNECKLAHAYALLKEQQIDPFEFDFHRLQVKETKIIIMEIISFFRAHRILINGNSVAPSIKLITGKGNNSFEGYSKLNASIKKLLTDENIYFENESSSGTIVIKLNK